MADDNKATATFYVREKGPILFIMLLVGYILIRTLWVHSYKNSLGMEQKALKMEDKVVLTLLHFYPPSFSVSTDFLAMKQNHFAASGVSCLLCYMALLLDL